jgi:ribonuclease Z
MPPAFHPRLVNPPFGDPGLFIPFSFHKRAILIDLGDIDVLAPKDLLKVSHVFVSHTHMDHFSGFDRLLRLLLGRKHRLSLYGPAGFLQNVEGKLSGYTWNLVKNYRDALEIQATEVHPNATETRRYRCEDGFTPRQRHQTGMFDGTLVKEPSFTISARVLDHGIPCLGFAIQEPFHVNIIKEHLKPLGLEIGSWLRQFKEALYRAQGDDRKFTLPDGRVLHLQQLAEDIALITPGQKMAYITDVVCSSENLKAMHPLVKEADHLFIEAAFMHDDAALAFQKRHLTARQAGQIAGWSGAKRFTPFHYSPRYSGLGHRLEAEARCAYEQGLLRSPSVV